MAEPLVFHGLDSRLINMQGRRALSREGVAARRSCIRVSIREEENVGRNERVACTTRQAGAVGPLVSPHLSRSNFRSRMGLGIDRKIRHDFGVGIGKSGEVQLRQKNSSISSGG